MNSRPYFKQASAEDFAAIEVYRKDLAAIKFHNSPCPVLEEELRQAKLLAEFIAYRVHRILANEGVQSE